MPDVQERLRNAITASLDGAEPSFDVLAAVRRRHRQRMRRLAVAVPVVVTVLVATAVILSGRHPQPGHHVPVGAASKPGKQGPSALAFPGGGRLLVDSGRVLSWLYPDGRAIRIPGRFDAASVSAGQLLAWRYTAFGATYYTMNLNGSSQRLVLSAGHNKKLSVVAALLSPDGSTLAYIRQDLVSPAIVTDTLWVLNPATGQRADLGAVSDSGFAWMDSTTILTDSPDGKSLQLVNASTGRRTTYLTVTDPVLVHAYARARPGVGQPAYIGSDGIAEVGGSARIAVWLAASRKMGTFQPAVVVLAGRTPLVTYAPPTPEVLSLTWGPYGLVVLQTGHGDDPVGWQTYAGTLQGPYLSRPWPLGMDGATFNPAGNVIALQDGGTVNFVSTPRPACDRTARCLSIGSPHPLQSGNLQAWIP